MSYICKNPDCTAPESKRGKIYPSAMECPFCDAPLVEIVDLSESELNLIGSLPYVVAYPLKRALVEKHPLTRINLLRDTFLNYLKYIGLITASEFFNSPIKDKNMVALFNRTLTETSFGLWNEFIREMQKYLNNKNHTFFCPELNDYYIAIQTGSNRKLYKGEIYIQDAYGEMTISKQNLTGIDSLINFRNRYLGHQQTLDDATYVILWEQYFPIFRDLLVQMNFCVDYHMYKTEHGETYRLQSDELKQTETATHSNSNVWIEDCKGNRLDILPFFVVPGELSIKKEDKEQILIYESYTGKSIKFFSPEGTEKLTSGKILDRLNLLLREKQQEQPYTPERFTKEIFIKRIADENNIILDTLVAEKKVIHGVYVNRQDIEIKLKEWIGARASIFFIAAEAGSGKTNLLAEMQKQYAERGFNSLLIRVGRMERQGLKQQIIYLLNIDESAGLGAYQSIAGTQDAPTFILIDGLNEAFHPENLWLEILEICKLFQPGSIKFVVAVRANSKADLDCYPVSDDDMDCIYGENKDREKGLTALTHWLTALNMEEMKLAWEGYCVKDKSRFKPLFSFDDIAGFDRTIYNQINNPLVLRIFLEVYNQKNLPKKGNTHLNIWKDWFARFSKEEQTFLDLLAAEVWVKGENELLLDDLLKNDALKNYLVSNNINTPYQRLKSFGWISRYVKDFNVCIGFTVEGVLFYIFGLQLQKRVSEIDVQVIDDLLKSGSKIQIAGLEAFLSEMALLENLDLVSKLIDSGNEKLEICIRPLLNYMKAFGVDATLTNLLANTTDNDWRALLKLNKMMNELQLQKLREEYLENIISQIPFNNKYDTKLGLQAIAIIDSKKSKYYYSKINYSSNFIISDSELLSELGKCEIRFAEYNKALEFYQQCLNIELKNHSGEHPDVAGSYNNIGLVWDYIGQYDKALEFFQKSLDMHLKMYGSEHSYIATSYHNMGGVLDGKGEYDRALEFYHISLGIRLKILGGEHTSVAILYNDIGLVWRKKGEYDKALEFHQKGLNIQLKTLGVKHPDIATSHSNIGAVWHDKGEYDKALEFYQQCLDVRIKTLGGEHPDVATSYGNIGLLWYDKGKYDKALEFYQKSLEIKLKKLGQGHPDLAISYSNMGAVWHDKGEYDKALEFHQKGLDMVIKTLGGEHPDVATSYLNIGQVWYEKGEYDKAFEYYQQCLDVRIKTLGGEHPSVAILYSSIGLVWRKKGEYDKALEFYQKSMEINLKKLGQGHSDLAISYNNMGAVWYDKGEYDKALEFFQKGLDIKLKTLGEEHPDVAILFYNIGSLWHDKGEFNQALEFYQKGLDIQLKILGREHPNVAQSYNNIGVVWDNKGEYDKALEFYQKSLDIELKILGGEHPSIATSYSNIGIVWDNKGEYDKALEFYQKSLDIELKSLGDEHPDVAKTYNKMGLVFKNKGEYESAIELFKKGFKILKKGGFPFKIAELYEVLGDKQEALSYFIQSAGIRKEDPDCGLDHNATIDSIQNSQRLAKELGREIELPNWMKS